MAEIREPYGFICITTNKVFDTTKEASEFYNCDKSSISRCCKGKLKSVGKNSETGEKLVWMYYDEYIKTDTKELIK